MAIKAGQILHAMNTFVVDRIQTAGANLSIPTERIYELGNYQSVAVIRDIPDLSFDLDVLDVGVEIEALLTQLDPTGAGGDSAADGTKYTLTTNFPVDIVSPMKSRTGEFDIVKSVVVPGLALESASYRYGFQENAGQQFTLQGDAIYYSPGYARVEYDPGGVSDADFTDTPLPYNEGGNTYYALSVTLNGERLLKAHTTGDGGDYTETVTGITMESHITYDGGTADTLRVVYATAAAPAVPYDQTVHAALSVKPAAIRGKDIDVLINGVRWGGVQSVNVDWRVDLEEDYEFGQARAIAREATDAPEVSGTVEIRPRNPNDLFTFLRDVTGVGAAEVIGPESSVPLTLDIVLKNPETGGTSAVAVGAPIKTLYVPDARFTIPGYEGRVQSKSDFSLEFESDTGVLEIFKGARA